MPRGPKPVEPSACAWCDVPQRGHAVRYTFTHKWHTWQQPHAELIEARLVEFKEWLKT